MPTKLLPGQRPPLAVITPDDQGGAIFVTGGLALAICAVALVVRSYVRAGYMNNTFGADDILIAIAFVFLIAESGALFKATDLGLGKTTDLIAPKHLAQIQQSIYATDILYLITLWLTRFSSALFFVRLSRTTSHKWASRALFVFGGIFSVASILIVSLRCDLSHPWLFADRQCTGLFERWVAVTILDCIYEIALFCVPAYMIWGLQMKGRAKVKVIAAFASRLLVLVPDILHLTSISNFYRFTNGKTVSSYDESLPFIYIQITLAIASIAATIPSLRPFMMATATSFGLVTGSGAASYGDPMSGHYNKSKRGDNISKNGAPLSLRSLKGNAEAISTADPADRWNNRSQEREGYSATAYGGEDRRAPSLGSDEQPIIRRDVQYTVRYSGDREAINEEQQYR